MIEQRLYGRVPGESSKHIMAATLMLDAAFEDKLKDARARRAAALASRGETSETQSARPARAAGAALPSLAAASSARPMTPRTYDGPVDPPRPRPRAEITTQRPRSAPPPAPVEAPAPRQRYQPARPTLLPAALFTLRRSLAGMATITGPKRVAPLIAVIFAAGIGIGALATSFGPDAPAPATPPPAEIATAAPLPAAATPFPSPPPAPAPVSTAAAPAATVSAPPTPAISLALPAIEPAPPLAPNALSDRPYPRPRALTSAPATDGGLSRTTEARATARLAASGAVLTYPDAPALRSALGDATAARVLATVPAELPDPAGALPAGTAPEAILEILQSRATTN